MTSLHLMKRPPRSPPQAFCKLHSAAGGVRAAEAAPTLALMPVSQATAVGLDDDAFNVPSLSDMVMV